MALGSYETALGWLGSENRKSSIRVFFDYKQLCTSKLRIGAAPAPASPTAEELAQAVAYEAAQLAAYEAAHADSDDDDY